MDFKKLELEHISALRPYFERNKCRICDCTIGGTFMWRDYFKTEFAIENEILYIRADYFGDGVAYTPPRGEWSAAAYDALLRHCMEEGTPLRLCSVSQSRLEFILSLYPNAKYRTDRAWSDYIYRGEDLRTLAGRRYSAQRNHISRFKRANPDFSFEDITRENIPEVKAFLERSFDERQKDSPTYNEGNRKTFEVLDNFEQYGQLGGVLRVNGEIAGMSFGEVSDGTLYVHVERADIKYGGVYQMLTNLFANRYADETVMYINREEDDGDEGLRKAKLAYHPSEILDKYFVEI